MWLAPTQIKLLGIIEKHHLYILELQKIMADRGMRVEVDLRNEKIGYKIREAQLEKVPYMLVIGDKEMENHTVAVRSRKEGDLGSMSVDEFISKALEEISTRAK